MNVESNSPLQIVPEDYCPAGSELWFRIPDGYDAGKTLFYSDHVIGDQPPENTVLFVHGNPESSYTFRHIRDELIASQASLRLVAMDHIGFGVSDRATFEMVDMHHSANLLQLIRHLDLHNVTLVVHDWGGPIGIGACIQEPARVKHLVVLNTTVFPMPGDDITYTNYPISWCPWSKTPSLVPGALWGGVSAYVVSHTGQPQRTFRFLSNIVKYMLLHGLRQIPENTPEYVWSQMLRDPMNAKSSKRNVSQTPVWGHGYSYMDRVHGQQDNHVFYEMIQSSLPAAWGPQGQNIKVCGFFGQWDACGKGSVIRQWHKALPQMKAHTYAYPGVGHFIEEYKGPEIAEAILNFTARQADMSLSEACV